MASGAPESADWTSPVEISKTGVELLSSREKQVLEMASAGFLDKQIGHELGISLNTLRTYWGRIRTKLGEAPRAALVAAYTEHESYLEEFEWAQEVGQGYWIYDVKTGKAIASDEINDAQEFERGTTHDIGKYLDRVHPEDRQQAADMLNRMVAGEVDHAHVVYRRVLPSGIDVVSASVRTVRNKAGEVVKVIGSFAKSADFRPGRDPRVRIGSWQREIPSNEYWISDELREVLQIREDEEIRAALLARTQEHDRERSIRLVDDAIARGDEWVHHEGELILPDNTRLWARVSLHVVKLGEGRYRVLGTLATFH